MESTVKQAAVGRARRMRIQRFWEEESSFLLDHRVLWLQTRFLKLFGFIPWTSKNPFLRRFFFIFASLQLLLVTAKCSVTVLAALNFILGSSQKGSCTFLIKAFGKTPWILENWRSLVVLLLLFRKHGDWDALCRTATHLIKSTFSQAAERKRAVLNWQKTAAILSGVTFAMHLLWEVLGFLCFPYSDANPESQNISSTMATSDAPLVELDLPVDFGKIGFFSEIWIFLLSQQVLVCVLVFAFILRDSLRKINQEIETVRVEILFFKTSQKTPSRLDQTEEPSEILRKKAFFQLAIFEKKYSEMSIFNEQLNSFFGTLLFVMYGFDLTICLGYMASAIANVNAGVGCFFFTYGSIFIFGSYATVFFVPLIMAHEEVSPHF
jgi:hypothetical protein